MSSEQRAAINQRRRESYRAKKLGDPEVVERMRAQERTPARLEGKKQYKRRAKEFRANNLHSDSIAIQNPKWVPELIFPTSDVHQLSPINLEIPDLSPSPAYFVPVNSQPDDVQSTLTEPNSLPQTPC